MTAGLSSETRERIGKLVLVGLNFTDRPDEWGKYSSTTREACMRAGEVVVCAVVREVLDQLERDSSAALAALDDLREHMLAIPADRVDPVEVDTMIRGVRTMVEKISKLEPTR